MATQADTNRHRRAAQRDADLKSSTHPKMLAAALRAQSFLGTGWLCGAVSAAAAAGPITPRPTTHKR